MNIYELHLKKRKQLQEEEFDVYTLIEALEKLKDSYNRIEKAYIENDITYLEEVDFNTYSKVEASSNPEGYIKMTLESINKLLFKNKNKIRNLSKRLNSLDSKIFSLEDKFED